MSTDYRAGTCNIGRPEQRLRYRVGLVGFAVAGALVLAAVWLSLPRWILLATVVPLFGGFIGVYQGREQFCVRFAMAGVYNVSDRLGQRVEIADHVAAKRDRRKARRLVIRTAIAAVVGSVLLYWLVPL